MEKAKLINIRKSKKGKLIGEVQFEDGKTMSIPPGAKLNVSLNNIECSIERNSGAITNITIDGKVIFSKASNSDPVSQKINKKHYTNKTTKQAGNKAAQPLLYRFIPHSRKILYRY